MGTVHSPTGDRHGVSAERAAELDVVVERARGAAEAMRAFDQEEVDAIVWAMTVAGLRWLHDERQLGTGMLYVDASNAPAVGLYEQLGFTRHSTDRAYFATVS